MSPPPLLDPLLCPKTFFVLQISPCYLRFEILRWDEDKNYPYLHVSPATVIKIDTNMDAHIAEKSPCQIEFEIFEYTYGGNFFMIAMLWLMLSKTKNFDLQVFPEYEDALAAVKHFFFIRIKFIRIVEAQIPKKIKNIRRIMVRLKE